MKKIALNYDDSTGNITLDDGTAICSWMGLAGHDVTAERTLTVDDLIALKKADFTVEEIAELKRQKILP